MTLVRDGSRIQKRVQKVEQRLDKVLARSILNDLKRQKGKGINDQAYDLLTEDINWLINN